MSRARAFSAFFILLPLCCASFAQTNTEHYGVGNPSVFLEKYEEFKAERIRSGEANLLRISLGHVKGVSRSFTGAAGEITVDLETGKFTATLRGLKSAESYSLWLMDRPEAVGDQTPRFKDGRTVKLAELRGSATIVSGNLGTKFPAGFSLDRVNLLRGGLSQGEVVASGSINVFQKIFYRRIGETAATEATSHTSSAEERLAYAWLIPDLAAETLVADGFVLSPGAAALLSVHSLISQGATLFFDRTFSGNGRTCGTCHPRSNNFTIDVPFIASLPATDPLFVAEFNPALAQLERPALMRQFGLILENIDGLDDPTNKFVMRSVPHTLALNTSLERDTTLSPPAPAQMTGWSGDGAPGAGSLRDFALGAVTQHFTKSLARIEGPDFHLPSEHQLDALEAFQLSLGRAADFDLFALVFTDANVDHGRELFVDGTGSLAAEGTCFSCHAGGGARTAGSSFNGNSNTNVEDVVNPARAVDPFPIDGGFGLAANPDGSFGNRTFNAPPVAEAADTAPFFHNNIAGTLEDLIAFYSGPVFNGPRFPPARFSFNPTQTAHLANFLRALNALQNIQVARRELQEIYALTGNPLNEIQTRLETATFDTEDAIAVLNQGGIYATVVPRLTSALDNIAQASLATNPSDRNPFIKIAIARLSAANYAIAH